MSDGYLTIEHGHVNLGGELLPGILVALDIGDSVRFDSAKVDNESGKKKTPLGWEDALINLEIELLTDETSTCYEKLAKVNAIFKGHDNNANPKVFDIVNAHVIARGVDQVVFSGLKSAETDNDDIIKAGLSFTEHNPPVIHAENRVAMSDSQTSSAPGIKQNQAETDSAITADDSNSFDAGFKEGIS